MTSKRRLVLAWLAGTLTIFVWGGLAHMVLMRGVGFSAVRDEDALVVALQGALHADGLYAFPSPDFSGHASDEETQAWERRFRAGPTGFIVYHPSGSSPVSMRKLVMQLLADMIAAAVAMLVVARMRGAAWARAAVVGLLGMFACASVATIYWNWYGYPHAFFVAQCVDMIVGWSLAGAAIAGIVADRDRHDRAPASARRR